MRSDYFDNIIPTQNAYYISMVAYLPVLKHGTLQEAYAKGEHGMVFNTLGQALEYLDRVLKPHLCANIEKHCAKEIKKAMLVPESDW